MLAGVDVQGSREAVPDPRLEDAPEAQEERLLVGIPGEGRGGWNDRGVDEWGEWGERGEWA